VPQGAGPANAACGLEIVLENILCDDKVERRIGEGLAVLGIVVLDHPHDGPMIAPPN
jgi:hypothetical protein